MTDIIERSFQLNLSVLSLFGLYPRKNSVSEKLRGYVCYVLLLVTAEILIFVKILLRTDTDLVDMSFDVIYLIEAAASSFKYLPFLMRGNRIKKCINYFGDRTFEARSVDDEEVLERCVEICRKNSLIYLTGVSLMAVLWIIPPLIEHKMPLNVWLPYDPNDNSLLFYGTFCFLLANFYYICLLDQTDPLMGCLVYHAKSQLQILKSNLQNLDKQFEENFAFDLRLEDVNTLLRECANRHQRILDFIVEYENCFSLSIFPQIGGSILIICFCCIGIILFTGVNCVKSAITFFIAAFQIFFYCYYGTLLFEENEKFIETVYMGNWYRYDTQIRKILIIMTERSKRSVLISVGGVVKVNLTLQTFASVIKTSYSLIAVFKK